MRKSRRRLLSLLPAFFAALVMIGASVFLYSCYPNGPEELTDFDTVVTAFDKNTNFKSINTYALPDTIVHISNPDDKNPVQIDIPQAVQDDIIALIRTEMNTRGYTEIPNPTQQMPPDVVLLVMVTVSENYQAYVSYPWFDTWGYYWGWGVGDANSGVEYPWAPEGFYQTTAYNYTTGSLIMDMFDSKNFDPDKNMIKSLWVGAANGADDDSLSDTDRVQRYRRAILQAFDQSPYLDKNSP